LRDAEYRHRRAIASRALEAADACQPRCLALLHTACRQAL
jgi:hypothetical protein